MKRSSLWGWLLMFVPLLAMSALVWHFWPRPREVFYSLYREHGKAQALAGLQGYSSQSSEHFEVRFTDKDRNVVDMVLKTAEADYEPVTKQVGYRPAGKIPVIIYSSRDELRKAFGWGKSESAMGVYWSGTIRLLSPNVWIDESSAKARLQVFQHLNPVAHELTHYVLDYMTNGNYPRWFTEGLAQRVEYKVTGYLWIESQSTLHQDLYTLDDLQNRFDTLENQPLAYRQSFLVVDFLARTYGEDHLVDFIDRLGQGVDFPVAVKQVFGASVSVVYQDCLTWVQANLEHLDPSK